MTLGNTLLERLNSWRPSGRQTLTVRDSNGWTVQVTADAADVVGCRLWELALERSEPVTADLKGWAERLTGRVTGLLEPLVLVEVDQGPGLAQLRSESPAQRGEDRYFYEVVLHHQAAIVRRYRAATPGQRRESVAFALTHEAVAKLVDDLLAE